MQEPDVLEIARKMRGPDGGRVMVLDVDFSSRKYAISLGPRASRHAYYLRPPDGMIAADLKEILDSAGGEDALTFRYYVYPELQTDLKPLLTADPFAGKYFDRNEDHKLLQIEGERPRAREMIANLLDALREAFKPEEFPRINELVLTSSTPPAEGKRTELVLLRKDRERDELRKMEPGFHIAVAEHGFAKEIDIHRPVVAETEPILILSSNQNTTDEGHRFLCDLAAYFGTEIYAEKSHLADEEAAELIKQARSTPVPSASPRVSRAPSIQPVGLDEAQLVTKVAAAVKELLPSMKLLKKRELSQRGNHLTVQFPGAWGFGKGPSEKEIQELKSVFLALRADASFGHGWKSYYQVDGKTGEMRIATCFDAPPSKDWIAL